MKIASRRDYEETDTIIANWTTENVPDLTGQAIIVTGANSGIGFGGTAFPIVMFIIDAVAVWFLPSFGLYSVDRNGRP